MSEIQILDCLGALCPTPIIQLSKAIRSLDKGERLILKADDPATQSDLLAWPRTTANSVQIIDSTSFEIEKG